MWPLIALYRWLDRMQKTRWFRIIVGVIALTACVGFFGSLLWTSHDIDAQRQSLFAALSNQSVERGDEHAISLMNTGEVFVNNRRYGGPEFLTPRIPLFDEDGQIIRVGALVESLLQEQRPHWAPGWLLDEPATALILAIACTAWLMLIVGLSLTLQFVLTLIATAVPVVVCLMLDQQQLMLGVAGIGVLTFTFLLLSQVSLLLLRQPHQIPAVGHTVIKEASRRGIGLVFIIVLLGALPMLPLMLDPESPLRFRIQTFISTSLGLTFAVAAVMTLFFSCATVAFEIRDRQIWQLMTKPVARWNYLLGKWLGVAMLNLVIVTVAGISTFAFVQYMRSLPVENSEAGQMDLLAVRDEVLTARIGGKPDYQTMTPEDLRERFNEVIENDPQLSKLENIPPRTRRELEQKIKTAFTAGLRSVPVGGYREYVFSGLKEAKRLGATLTLRYKFYILADDEHKTFDAGFVFNDDPNLRRKSTFVPSISHSFPIPASIIRDDGTLKVSIHNLTPRDGGGAINFEEDSFELLYQVASFEGNFFRAMLTIWIKLVFLAALGISCATFLNFPVACLLAFTVFFGGMLGPYLAESLDWYYPVDASRLDWTNVGMVIQWAFESMTRAIASGVVFLLSSFGEYRPTQNLVEGKLIAWPAVLMGFVKLDLVWSGLAMVVGYLVLRRRQLAIYSGQG